MFIKSVYLKQPSEEQIISSIDSGIDTIFLNLNAGNTKEELKFLFDEYYTKVNLVPFVFYTQPGKRIQTQDQFLSNGKYYHYIVCPTNINMIRKLLEFSLDLYADGLCSSVCINFKNYEVDEDWSTEDNKCECSRCKELTGLQQKIRNMEIINESLKGMSLYSLPYVNPFLWTISDYWINENTYTNKWRSYRNIYQYIRTMGKRNISIKNMSVVKFSMVKKAIKSVMTDGYCIYPDEQIDLNALTELNDNADKWRGSWWFKFKRWVIGGK